MVGSLRIQLPPRALGALNGIYLYIGALNGIYLYISAAMAYSWALEAFPDHEFGIHAYKPGSKVPPRVVAGSYRVIINGLPGCIQGFLTMAHLA